MAQLTQVVSGGQTGVDRAALDAALSLNFPVGGWCPRGRRAEDGPLASRYPLIETPSRHYAQRTEWNVRDSDATLIMCVGPVTGGTALTLELTRSYRRLTKQVDLSTLARPDQILDWINQRSISVLNVAGPRESGCPGIYEQAYSFMRGLLLGLK